MKSVTELPFNRFVGIEAANSEGRLLRLPAADEYLNHLGTVHASALLALAEAASGEFLLRQFGEVAEIVPVVRRMEAKFRRPAKGAVTAAAKTDEAELTRVEEDLARKGRALFHIEVELQDEAGERVFEATVEWFLQRRA